MFDVVGFLIMMKIYELYDFEIGLFHVKASEFCLMDMLFSLILVLVVYHDFDVGFLFLSFLILLEFSIIKSISLGMNI